MVLTGELDVTITVPLKSRRCAANYAEHCVEREKLPGKLRSIKYENNTGREEKRRRERERERGV